MQSLIDLDPKGNLIALIAGTKVVYPEQPLEEIFGEVIASPKERLMQSLENNLKRNRLLLAKNFCSTP